MCKYTLKIQISPLAETISTVSTQQLWLFTPLLPHWVSLALLSGGGVDFVGLLLLRNTSQASIKGETKGRSESGLRVGGEGIKGRLPPPVLQHPGANS